MDVVIVRTMVNHVSSLEDEIDLGTSSLKGLGMKVKRPR